MHRITQPRKLLAMAAWLALCTHGMAEMTSRLSTRFLARGEQALLEIAVTGARPDTFPEIPSVAGVEIRPAGSGARAKMLPGRRLEHVFEYLVSSYETGNHVLPTISASVGGSIQRTEPLEFTVFNPDELRWSEAVAGGTRFRYASAFRALNTSPFEGETTPVEIKIYVPRDLFVEDWGIPDFQRDGVTAWRFQPSAMRGQVNLFGMPHVSVAYPSTLTPTRKGPVAIGPATVRLITTEVVMEGILRRVSHEVHLTVPGLELESRPLPEGAPEGFENAIGNFDIQVSTPQTEMQEGDPIPLEIVVSGSGNLDTLRPPKPVDAEGWRLYDASPETRGDERRELSGTVVFRQFVRPLEIKSALPAFRMVFFDPKAREYKTLLTDPIPLRMTPSAGIPGGGIAPPQKLSMPVERMTDILGVLDIHRADVRGRTGLPAWSLHALAALLALILIAKALWMRHGHRFHRDPRRVARLGELREIEGLIRTADDSGFLIAAGRFIERWLGTHPPDEAAAVLAERDRLCFRGDTPSTSSLDLKRRREIVKSLRGMLAAWLAIMVLGITSGSARASDAPDEARQAYDAARYDEAAALWLKSGDFHDLPADVLYNIGNACYRAGSPGHAALYYRRALARDPGHQESRQNLRFIERKHGAITVHRPDYQYVLARIPLAAWQGMLWSGLWLCALGLLVFPATRPGAWLRPVAVIGLVVAPLLAAAGALGWRHFPNDAQFAPLERQAVIVVEKAVLHSDAARTSPEVIDAPPGSLCEVIRESGRWAYVGFASKTRGWVPVESIERIIPHTPPAPPKIRKPKADGKTA
jgi:tetratricopeptide (TPR) repeat protein